MNFQKGDKVICICKDDPLFGETGRFFEYYDEKNQFCWVALDKDQDDGLKIAPRSTLFYTSKIQYLSKAKFDIL